MLLVYAYHQQGTIAQEAIAIVASIVILAIMVRRMM